MRNKLLIIFLFFFQNVFAENISIIATDISIDKNNNTSIFKNNVIVKTKDKTIKSDYANYNKETGYLFLEKDVRITDDKNNKMFTEYVEYFEKDEIFKTKGPTKVETSEGYILEGEDLFLDNKQKIIKSNKKSNLTDIEQNNIILDSFEFLVKESLFKSIGFIEITDSKSNKYEFTQIYIDTKKNEIIGTDSKAFLNDPSFKINSKNNPRVFSNSINIKKEESSFEKSIFTLCQYRKNDDCPPWTIQSKKMLHDNIKKTIYYNNAVIKVYDIPIMFFPKLSHPDPTVDRRSGFLIPSFSDSKNLGSGVSIPYFFDLGLDKNLTLTNRLYVTENPLFLGEYHQAFKDSNFLADFGYTDGYKKTNDKKKGGAKSHLFAKYLKNFKSKNENENSIEINIQEVSNDKYLKLYKIQSNLADYNNDNLENSFNFTHEGEDLFFGLSASVYETLKNNYEDKYEYILPELTLDKNLFYDDRIGALELQSNYKFHSFETNKSNNFLINELNYESNNKLINNTINSKILGNLKNINYESKNVDQYKNDPTTEIFASVGLFSEINLEKYKNNFRYLLKPKSLIRLSPGSMRKENEGSRLSPSQAFSMNRISNINNYETGISGTLGLDYKIKDNNNLTKFDFSLAQIINEKENKKMSDKSSLNEKISDLVGSSNYIVNENFELSYNFSLDQNYNDLNYNEFGANYNIGALDVNFDYLNENKHIGDQDYFKTELNLKNRDKGLLSFKTKRNLITNSSEFYDLSYEYINDCLRAGLVYRREFYNDSELEPEDSLMFKLTLVPFGNLDSPKFD